MILTHPQSMLLQQKKKVLVSLAARYRIATPKLRCAIKSGASGWGILQVRVFIKSQWHPQAKGSLKDLLLSSVCWGLWVQKMHCLRVLHSQKSRGGDEKQWLHYRNDYNLPSLCSPSPLLQVPAQVDLPPRRPPSGPFLESMLCCSVLYIRLHFPQSFVLYMCWLVGWLSATPTPSTGLSAVWVRTFVLFLHCSVTCAWAIVGRK